MQLNSTRNKRRQCFINELLKKVNNFTCQIKTCDFFALDRIQLPKLTRVYQYFDRFCLTADDISVFPAETIILQTTDFNFFRPNQHFYISISYIHNWHETCIKMSTNKSIIGLVVLEMIFKHKYSIITIFPWKSHVLMPKSQHGLTTNRNWMSSVFDNVIGIPMDVNELLRWAELII